MTVWTISAEEGAGGARIAADLATAADVPLLDFKTLVGRAQDYSGTCPTWRSSSSERAVEILLAAAGMAPAAP